MKENWKILGQELKPGEKKNIYVETGAKGYELPVTLCCGADEGKTLLVTAQIHSHECNGTPAAIRASKAIDPAKLKGNVIFIHCVNLGGFIERYPRFMPEGDFNLNGNFPEKDGCEAGNFIARWFINEIYPHTDFICDLHGGSMDEPLTPCTFFLRNSEESFEAAKQLDCPILIASDAATGMYSYAYKNYNISGVLLERGWGVSTTEEWIEGHRKNICLIMEHLGMYDWKMQDMKFNHTRFNKSVYINATKNALWYPNVTEGQTIKKGQALGHTEDFFGNIDEVFLAEGDGVVYYYTAGLSAAPGLCLVAYGLLDESEEVIMDSSKEKKALIVLSFGTSYEDAFNDNIKPVEKAIADAMPDYDFFRAFGSRMIIRKLKNTGRAYIDTLAEALERVHLAGYKEVVVQPTFFIHGYEYDMAVEAIQQRKYDFTSIKIGHPLFNTPEDYEIVAKGLMEEYKDREGALVLMGHGTDHFANAAYTSLQNLFNNLGNGDIYLGTVEGYPTIDDIKEKMLEKGVKKALLAPLMLVAGDHANNDLAGEEEDSWKNILEAAGIQPECRVIGMGSFQSIKDIFVKHALEAAEK